MRKYLQKQTAGRRHQANYWLLAILFPLLLTEFFHLPAAYAQNCGLYTYKAQITEVYDGDTVTADIDLGFHTWRRDEKLRLYEINAPEMRGGLF
jgi:endonuclease YncB( thermonuclease family)